MTNARGSQQDRSRERRERLLEAAVQVISQRGVRAVTHRAVSAEAGLPSATAGYYFATVSELIEAALEFHVRTRVEQLTELITPPAHAVGTLDEMARFVASAVTTGASPATLAQYDVYLEAARNPNLRAVVAESIATFEGFVSQRLALLGIGDPRRAAKAFLAVIDGFALHRLAFPQSTEEDAELLYQGLRGVWLTFALPQPDIDRLARQPLPPSSTSR